MYTTYFDSHCRIILKIPFPSLRSGGHSIGSNKSSRSSGKSSSLSHDSMDGTPRMIRRSESITTPKTPSNTTFIIPTNPSVILNKKTIRNYVPPESTNMLRSFEDNRKSNQIPESKEKTKPEKKSSVDKLIDDFHRNLPSPPPSTAKLNESNSLPFSDGESLFSGSGLNLDESRGKHHVLSDKSFRAGTVTSQTSHWSVASSAASFDYHSVNSMENRTKKTSSEAKKKVHEIQNSYPLPSLDEVDVGERIPPEGASAESPNNTVAVRKVVETNNNERADNNNKNKQVSNHNNAKDPVGDLLKASENDDDLHMLRKLISEGRISGLNEKPPPFVPPTPPVPKLNSSQQQPKRRNEGQVGSSKSNDEKHKPGVSAHEQKASSKQEFSQATKSGDRPRKARDAPKPPTQQTTQSFVKSQEIQVEWATGSNSN